MSDNSSSAKANTSNGVDSADHDTPKLSHELHNILDDIPNPDVPKPSESIEVSIYDCRPYLTHISNAHLKLDRFVSSVLLQK